MAASSATTPPADPAPLRRDPAHAKLGGVAAGLARRLGGDPLAVRPGFVLPTLAGGGGALLSLLLWATLPAEEIDGPAPRFRTGRSAVEVGLGAALLLLSALLLARKVGVWSSDALVWPLVLVAGGGALLWRQSLAGAGGAAEASPRGEPAGARRRRARRRRASAARAARPSSRARAWAWRSCWRRARPSSTSRARSTRRATSCSPPWPSRSPWA